MMNSVGGGNYKPSHQDEDYYKEISHQLKKWAEENIGKLKEAKNLEDLVKIKLSTVNVVQNDKNSYWRNLINSEIKREQDIKNANFGVNKNSDLNKSPSENMQNEEQNK